MVGFPTPNGCWAEEVYQDITSYSGLNLEEFLRFVEGYVQRQRQQFAGAFALCDADNSNEVDRSEFAGLLRTLNIEPMSHVLEEVISEVDADRTGSLNFHEFETVMELIQEREGFTKAEFNGYCSIFRKHRRAAKDGSNEIRTDQMVGILSWLGLSIDEKKISCTVREIDINNSQTINEREFLLCMRKLRELEIRALRHCMEANDNDGNGTLSGRELLAAFECLGYHPDCAAVLDALRDSGDLASQGALSEAVDFDRFWLLLTFYRAREGFSSAEVAEFKEAFGKYDKHANGEISVDEAGKALRWLGFPLPLEMMQQLVDEVDVDASGRLDFVEFLKLLRIHETAERLNAKEAFFKEDSQGSGDLSQQAALRALQKLGCVDALNQPVDRLPSEELAARSELIGGVFGAEGTLVDLGHFMEAFVHIRRQTRKVFRQNCGFAFEEVLELKEHFRLFDKDKSGDIGTKEVVALIECTFPGLAHDAEMRPKLLEVMRAIDGDGNGSIDFDDFLRFMQVFREEQDEAKIAKEKQAVVETGFTRDEVKDFRSLFLAADTKSTFDLSFAQVKAMIHRIVPIRDDRVTEFGQIFRNVASKPCWPENEGPVDLSLCSVTFPQFLRLMRQLLDVDFAQIRSKTALAKR